jgi:TPR repeat protein
MTSSQTERFDHLVYRQQHRDEFPVMETVEKFRELASEGYAPAQRKMAAFSEGMGKPEEAKEWLLKAVAQNDPAALKGVGYWYYLGKNGLQKSHTKAFDYYSQAAEMGDPDAMLNLGQMYEEGEGCIQSYQKAADCYRKLADPMVNPDAIENPDKDACFHLGCLLYMGKLGLTDKSKAEGLIMLQDAKEGGHPGAREILKAI